MILIMTLMLVMIAIMTIHDADKIKMIQEEVQGGWDWVIVLYSARLLYKLCTAPSIPGSAGLNTSNKTEKKSNL